MELRKTKGYDSHKVKALNNENGEKKPPFTPGACIAYIAWKQSIRLHEYEVELNDFLWEKKYTIYRCPPQGRD